MQNLDIGTSIMYYNMIEQGDIQVSYVEENNEANLHIVFKNDDVEKHFNENSDDFDSLVAYVQSCLLVASLAGFEAPSEYYKAIKEYIHANGDGKL